MTPVETLMQRLEAVFGEPPSPHPALFRGELRRVMQAYAPHVLEKVGSRIIDTFSEWPRPRQVRVLADAATGQFRRRKSTLPQKAPARTADAPQSVARMQEKSRSVIAEQLPNQGFVAGQLPPVAGVGALRLARGGYRTGNVVFVEGEGFARRCAQRRADDAPAPACGAV